MHDDEACGEPLQSPVRDPSSRGSSHHETSLIMMELCKTQSSQTASETAAASASTVDSRDSKIMPYYSKPDPDGSTLFILPSLMAPFDANSCVDDLSSASDDFDIHNSTLTILGIVKDSDDEQEVVVRSVQHNRVDGDVELGSKPTTDERTEDTVSHSSDSCEMKEDHQEMKEISFTTNRQSPYHVVACLVVLVVVLLVGTAIAVVVVPRMRSSVTNPSSPPAIPNTPSLSAVDVYIDRIILPLLTETSRNAIALPNTPQSRARKWLAADPQILKYTHQRIKQRYALATFFYATRGELWTGKDQWLTAKHECQWFSKRNDNNNDSACDNNETLVVLDLNTNNLTGTLPDDLSILSSLRK